jgi:uncharacterized protein (DUF342 family)
MKKVSTETATMIWMHMIRNLKLSELELIYEASRKKMKSLLRWMMRIQNAKVKEKGDQVADYVDSTMETERSSSSMVISMEQWREWRIW